MNTIWFIIGFISAIIEGKHRFGKSSYALHIIHDIFLSSGHMSEETWYIAIDLMIYTIYDIIYILKDQWGTRKNSLFVGMTLGVFSSNLRWFTPSAYASDRAVFPAAVNNFKNYYL
jgi:hypothetical protein